MTDTAPASPSPTAPQLDPAFLQQVQDWIAEKGAPASPHGADVLGDLKTCLAERDAIATRAQEAEKSLRTLTGQHAALSGKVDGFLTALQRIETKADPA